MRRYATDGAFKKALEQRLHGGDGAGLARRRQHLIYDRCLARIAAGFGDAATIKGGVVLKLRVAGARTTKDIDLRLVGSPGDVLARLREAGQRDLGDFMTFVIEPHAEHPTIQSDGMTYEGARFRVECRLANKIYGHRFGVDVAFGEPMFGEPEVIEADDVLGFAGVPPPRLRVYPVETHVAEKLHAYTMPRPRPNSRVKDLPDLALLASARPLEAMRVRAALEATFGARKTHELPPALPRPAASWTVPYATMARDDQLPWTTLDEVTRAVSGFLDPVLGGLDARWVPAAWKWRRR